jgi:fibronectin-binding autotransporter adhesin
MKSNVPQNHHSARGVACVLLPLLLTAGSTTAASTWSGAGSDTNWSTAANWTDSTTPTPSTTTDLVFTGSTALSNVNNFTAPTDLRNISFDSAAGAFSLSGSQINLNGSITSSTATAAVTIGNALIVPGTTAINLNGAATSSNITITGNISGAGTITQNAGGSGAKGLSLSGNNSGFTGTFIQSNNSNNRTAFNAATAGSASATWEFNRNVAGGVALNGMAGSTLNFGALRGGAFIRSNTTGTTTLSVGALNTSTTWSGQINDNGNSNIAVTKTGTGTLTFSGTNSYDGATTINGGTLELTSTGTISNSAVTVNNTGILKVASGKTINALTLNAGGALNASGNASVTNALSATGAGAAINLVNSTSGTVLSISGTGTGMTLGGSTATDTPVIQLEVAADTNDVVNVSSALVVDAGGVSIQISSLGIQANRDYFLMSYASASGAGFATGTGTTVGGITLANPSLAFGVSGTLVVTDSGITLHTTGASAPDAAYWSGNKGTNWSDNASGQGNFTTTAAGSSFLATSPGSNTQIYFSNNAATNTTNTLGANFDILGLTYRASSAAVTTTGSNQLTLESGGITVESGNGGATLGMTTLALGTDQTWTNNSSNPLTVSATTVTGTNATLTIEGSGGVQLGGTSFTVGYLQLNSALDLKGTSLTATFFDSSANITNTGVANSILTIDGSSPAALSGSISDGGSSAKITLVKNGSDNFLLSGANTYQGGTTLASGTLTAGSDSAFGSGLITITSGAATLDLNGHTLSNELYNSGATGSTITNNGSVTATVTGGFNTAGAANFVISDLTVNGTSDILWQGSIRRTSGTGTLTKNGANQLSITGSGVVSAMSLKLDEGSVFAGKTATSFQDLLLNGGTLTMDPSNQVATANIWSGLIGNTVVMNGGTWDLNGTGTNGVNNRVKRISGTGGTITNSSTSPALLVLAARDTAAPTWSGNIQDGAGSVALTLQWGGSVNQVMQFSGTHTYSGDTTIMENVMQAGAANVFSPNSTFIIPNKNIGGKLDLNNYNNSIGALSGDEPDARVLLGSATLTVGAKNVSTTFLGVITGTGGLVKTGTGTLALTGANTYTGGTVVNAGVLSINGTSLDDTSALSISSSGQVNVTGTEDVGSLVIAGSTQANGTYGATGSGAAHIDDVHFSGTGIVRVGGAGGYSTWAAANAGGQTAEQDYDGDGVQNGIEYFMNSAAGFTANPGIVSGTVTWPNGGNISSSAYGTDFVVQTSEDLVTWTAVSGSDSHLVNTSASLSYTLPTTTGKLFVRLQVNPQ